MAATAPSEQLRPATRTVSRCTTSRSTHSFEVTGYSVHRSLGAGHYVKSAPFYVGGYRWCLLFYPYRNIDGSPSDYIGVFLNLVSQEAESRAHYDFRLVDQTTGASNSISFLKTPYVFSTLTDKDSWGPIKFMKRSELESSVYLKDDRLIIECDVTVIKEEAELVSEVEEPPSELSVDFRKLLETGDGADVTFSVDGEAFPAHKIVLATRSPVFKAELFGLIGKDNQNSITIQDMLPAVFKALLHFMYTDSLPDMEDLGSAEKKDLIKYLLVAADRYALERLKLICEGVLSKTLDVNTVASLLALADQCNCKRLRDECIEYICASNGKELRDNAVQTNYGQLGPGGSFHEIFIHLWGNIVQLFRK